MRCRITVWPGPLVGELGYSLAIAAARGSAPPEAMDEQLARAPAQARRAKVAVCLPSRQVSAGGSSDIQGACSSTIRRVAWFISLMVRRNRYHRNRSRSCPVQETVSSARCAWCSVVLGWFMGVSFRSGGAGWVEVAGDPRRLLPG